MTLFHAHAVTVGGIQFLIVVAGGLPQSLPWGPVHGTAHIMFSLGVNKCAGEQPKVEAVIFCKLILEVTFIAFTTQKKVIRYSPHSRRGVYKSMTARSLGSLRTIEDLKYPHAKLRGKPQLYVSHDSETITCVSITGDSKILEQSECPSVWNAWIRSGILYPIE